jgi:tRNA pseudouridine55 synthase
LCDVLEEFRGTIQQTPPLYSAIKQGGKKLYELARDGVQESEVEIQSREVTISQLHLTRFVASDVSTQEPRAMLHIECSGGTYIRSLVRDIGRALGCGATMTFLVRTRNGFFSIDDARTAEAISNDYRAATLPVTAALALCAATTVTDSTAAHGLSQGQQIEAPIELDTRSQRASTERVLFVDEQHTIAAFAIRAEPNNGAHYKPEKVFFLDSDD